MKPLKLTRCVVVSYSVGLAINLAFFNSASLSVMNLGVAAIRESSVCSPTRAELSSLYNKQSLNVEAIIPKFLTWWV